MCKSSDFLVGSMRLVGTDEKTFPKTTKWTRRTAAPYVCTVHSKRNNITSTIQAYTSWVEVQAGSEMANMETKMARKGITRSEDFYIIMSVPICFVLILHSGLRGEKGGRKGGRAIYNSKGEFDIKKKRKIQIT